MKKILVVGSFHEKDPNQNPIKENQPYDKKISRFKAACLALGWALAKTGHEIMVSIPEWKMLENYDTACNFVMEGADQASSEVGKKTRVNFYGPKEIAPEEKATPNIVDSFQELEDLQHLDIRHSYLGHGAFKAKLITNVNDADGVIIIGGTDGTASIGYAAYSMHKPIVALPSLGGAAQQVHMDVLQDEYDQLISTTDIRDLEVYWKPTMEDNKENALNVVTIIDKLIAAKNKSSKKVRTALMITLGFQLCFLLAWMVIFLAASRCTAEQALCGLRVNVAFFALLFISALLGTGLRTLVAYHEEKLTQLTVSGFFLESVISLILAFALSLFYLIGGISFTGGVVVLDTYGSDSNTFNAFATISISMSLIGLAAGYLVPITQLQERLNNVISQEQK